MLPLGQVGKVAVNATDIAERITIMKLLLTLVVWIGALAYWISPVDILPDILPLIGIGDDIGIGGLAVFLTKKIWA